jgi:2-deoxy-D-gluconate 3-dehydrogenase
MINNPFNLEKKKAVITGGGRGLGLGMTKALHEAGAEIVIIGKSKNNMQVANEMSTDEAPVASVIGDLNDRKQLKSMFSEALDILGDINILINNAGVQSRYPCEDFPESDWDRVVEVNLTSVFLMCQLAGRKMLENKNGKIINIASMCSFFGGITIPAYSASKGGIMQLTKALSNEWAGRGVQVNAIAPGYMDTDLNTALINDEKRRTNILSRIPAGRWGNPEDMGGIAVFLASSASDYISGAIIPVDGGYLGR